MKNDFSFCPNCGGKKIQNVNMRKWKCDDCGFTLYNNVAAAVGLVIESGEGKILLEKRAKEPRKGFLALPGGFVDPDESAEEACIRECREELGVEPLSLSYIAAFPNTYDYKDIQYKTCDIFFSATLPDGAKMRTQESEVLSLEECSVRNESELAELPLAFESARKTLSLWLKKKEWN
ncbi:MAG: NUDIX domain-containing protein [Treponema sp.]|uniref:NUDIX hydrolase n=1 Tax=Treponema sp. TaxID=166 RepID=UPI0025ED9186|nr:NUDIX domain-containing protein [Treponema sp.]MBQ9282466.1 NUDIX domain-containing protein [Treponema sp.]